MRGRLRKRGHVQICLCCVRSRSDALDVVGPTLERGARLPLVFRSLVHSCHAHTMAAVVIEDRLDVVGLDAEFAKVGCAGSAKIMDAPRCDAYTLIKLLLGSIPVIESTLAKEIVGRVAVRLALQDSDGLARQW